MLPGINIEFENGNLGTVVPSADGILGVIAHATAPEGTPTFDYRTPYQLKSLAAVEALGIIDDVENHVLHKFFNEFFNIAGTGAEIWLICISKEDLLIDHFATDGAIEALLNTANGSIKGLACVNNSGASITIEDGLSDEVLPLVNAAQIYCVDYMNRKNVPVFTLVEGFAFNGTPSALPDLNEANFNRVAILIGDTDSRTGTYASKGAALGLLAGRIAKNSVHVNIGKVLDGAITAGDVFIKDTAPELFDVEALHDKGFISFRNHNGRSGYFFTDDPMATDGTEDYAHITNRRVIDKAYRIAYDTLLDEVLADIPVTNTGTIHSSYIKTLEGRVLGALKANMTNNGELSADAADPNDFGAICKISSTQNLVSTSRITLEYLRVRPKGIARYIDVPLGFVAFN
jgi:hypothetical protein